MRHSLDIKEIFRRNMPLSEEQFRYYLKLKEINTDKLPALHYNPINDSGNPHPEKTWEIINFIKKGTTPEELEEKLREKGLINKKEKLNIEYYFSAKEKSGPNLNANFKKLGMTIYFVYDSE